MAGDVELRNLNKTMKDIDRKLGDFIKGLHALNENLVAIGKILKGPQEEQNDA